MVQSAYWFKAGPEWSRRSLSNCQIIGSICLSGPFFKYKTTEPLSGLDCTCLVMRARVHSCVSWFTETSQSADWHWWLSYCRWNWNRHLAAYELRDEAILTSLLIASPLVIQHFGPLSKIRRYVRGTADKAIFASVPRRELSEKGIRFIRLRI